MIGISKYTFKKSYLVQLYAIQPTAQVHDSSVCRHESGLQLDEQSVSKLSYNKLEVWKQKTYLSDILKKFFKGNL